MKLSEVLNIISSIKCNLFSTTFKIRVDNDNKYHNGRIFIQLVYDAFCTKIGTFTDEYVKTRYVIDQQQRALNSNKYPK